MPKTVRPAATARPAEEVPTQVGTSDRTIDLLQDYLDDPRAFLHTLFDTDGDDAALHGILKASNHDMLLNLAGSLAVVHRLSMKDILMMARRPSKYMYDALTHRAMQGAQQTQMVEQVRQAAVAAAPPPPQQVTPGFRPSQPQRVPPAPGMPQERRQEERVMHSHRIDPRKRHDRGFAEEGIEQLPPIQDEEEVPLRYDPTRPIKPEVPDRPPTI